MFRKEQRREREAERAARQQARAFLLESRQRVEEALGLARHAADDAAAKEARRRIEEGIQGESAERTETTEKTGRESGIGVGDFDRTSSAFRSVFRYSLCSKP